MVTLRAPGVWSVMGNQGEGQESGPGTLTARGVKNCGHEEPWRVCEQGRTTPELVQPATGARQTGYGTGLALGVQAWGMCHGAHPLVILPSALSIYRAVICVSRPAEALMP